jgi:hypothetical protein
VCVSRTTGGHDGPAQVAWSPRLDWSVMRHGDEGGPFQAVPNGTSTGAVSSPWKRRSLRLQHQCARSIKSVNTSQIRPRSSQADGSRFRPWLFQPRVGTRLLAWLADSTGIGSWPEGCNEPKPTATSVQDVLLILDSGAGSHGFKSSVPSA